MNILDRFVLGLYTFFLAVISAVIILIGTNVIDYNVIAFYVQTIHNSSELMTVTTIVAAIFFLVSLRFLLSGPNTSKTKQAITKKYGLGNILISLNSIQNIVMNEIRQIDGVMEQKVVVANHKEKVKIKSKLIVTPEKSIPELSKLVQDRTKYIVESIAGVEVFSIEVYIDNVVQPTKIKIKSNVQTEAE